MAAPTASGSSECRAVLARLLGACQSGAPSALAAILIGEFGSLAATLTAAPERLAPLCGSDIARRLATVRAALLQSAFVEVEAAPVLSSSSTVVEYLRLALAHQSSEQVMVLFLDARNRLIRAETMFRGSLVEAACPPREIIGRALELGACGLIVAHNHPSGDPKPSPEDIRATRVLVDAARLFDMHVWDHLIVARAGTTSFHAMGLL